MSSCFETIRIVYSDKWREVYSHKKVLIPMWCFKSWICLNIPNSSTREQCLKKWCLTWDLCASGSSVRLRQSWFFAISLSKCKVSQKCKLHMYMVKSMYMKLEQRELLNHLIIRKNERKKHHHWELILRVWGSGTELMTDHHWCHTWSDANTILLYYYLLLGYGSL